MFAPLMQPSSEEANANDASIKEIERLTKALEAAQAELRYRATTPTASHTLNESSSSSGTGQPGVQMFDDSHSRHLSCFGSIAVGSIARGNSSVAGGPQKSAIGISAAGPSWGSEEISNLIEEIRTKKVKDKSASVRAQKDANRLLRQVCF